MVPFISLPSSSLLKLEPVSIGVLGGLQFDDMNLYNIFNIYLVVSLEL
jgi:hypothetical protein